MNRSDLIEKLADKQVISITAAEKIIVEIFKGMTETLVSGGRVEVRGFGNFEVRTYEGYTARNPKSGEKLEVKPKRAPFFKTGKELKERIARRRNPV